PVRLGRTRVLSKFEAEEASEESWVMHGFSREAKNCTGISCAFFGIGNRSRFPLRRLSCLIHWIAWSKEPMESNNSGGTPQG
ncbi:MAG: hypothetical protein ACK52S_13230, partial [Pirellula sp.]